MRTKVWLIGSAVLAVIGGGCGGASNGRTAAGSAADLEAIYRARTDSLRNRFIEADVTFISGMIGHHAQAIEMSKLAQTNGASPQVQTLAGRIINAQQDEIALMQQWLRDRKQPVPEIHSSMDATHAGHHAQMPGMLTPEQMKQLAQAKGREFDRLFLTDMIQHHQGAVTMVDALFKAGGGGRDEAVFKIANDVQVDQITEINRMKQMLANLQGSRD